VELKRQGSRAVHCITRNISEGGMGLRSASGVEVGQEFEIRFHLPEEQNWIEGHCAVMWTDEAGNAGVKFVHLPAADYKRMKEWIAEQYEKTPPALLVELVKKKKAEPAWF
jgi:c-di-GMP-binding flagellar brake protein YcgR